MGSLTIEDAYHLLTALLTTVGGTTVFVVGLSSWLGKLWAKRILQQEKAQHDQELERIKGELQRDQERLRQQLDHGKQQLLMLQAKAHEVESSMMDRRIESIWKLWDGWLSLRMKLRPLITIRNEADQPGRSYDIKVKKRSETSLKKVYEEALNLASDNDRLRPLIPAKIYTTYRLLEFLYLRVCRAILDAIRSGQMFDWYAGTAGSGLEDAVATILANAPSLELRIEDPTATKIAFSTWAATVEDRLSQLIESFFAGTLDEVVIGHRRFLEAIDRADLVALPGGEDQQ